MFGYILISLVAFIIIGLLTFTLLLMIIPIIEGFFENQVKESFLALIVLLVPTLSITAFICIALGV